MVIQVIGDTSLRVVICQPKMGIVKNRKFGGGHKYFFLQKWRRITENVNTTTVSVVQSSKQILTKAFKSTFYYFRDGNKWLENSFMGTWKIIVFLFSLKILTIQWRKIFLPGVLWWGPLLMLKSTRILRPWNSLSVVAARALLASWNADK